MFLLKKRIMSTWTFLKMSLSHMLSCLTTPFLSSASFLLNAKSSSHLFRGVLAWLKICREMRTGHIWYKTMDKSSMMWLYIKKVRKRTLSNMRLRRRGTTGKTVGCSIFRSSIRSRMSPWKYPIRAPQMRMTLWKEGDKNETVFIQTCFNYFHFVHRVTLLFN